MRLLNWRSKSDRRIFTRAGDDYIILNSAGCGAYMKEYETLFADEPEYKIKARSFSLKVKDIMEFLAENGWKTGKVDDLNVTYHDPCLAFEHGLSSRKRGKLNE